MLFSHVQGKFAAQFGAKGLILFSDPADYTVIGEPVYPDGVYLPPTGSQRGSCLDGSGDPLTPGYPAVGKKLNSLVEYSVTDYRTCIGLCRELLWNHSMVYVSS